MSQRLRNFLDVAPYVYGPYLEREAVPERRQCQECSMDDVVYRCMDCIYARVLCARCIVQSHVRSPFHVIEKFNGEQRFWVKCELGDLGAEIDLGHGGERCPSRRRARQMTIVHERGIGKANIRFCRCCKPGAHATPDDAQLVQAGLWPASWDTPRTAFTIGLMEQFRLLSVHAHTNAYDFFNYLARRTNDTFPADCDVSSKTPLYAFVRSDRLSGSVSGVHGLGARVQVLCNVQTTRSGTSGGNAAPLARNVVPGVSSHRYQYGPWLERATPGARVSGNAVFLDGFVNMFASYVDALFHAIDGNFVSNQKDKKRDLEDFPLTMGAAYFVDEKDAKVFQSKLGPFVLEVRRERDQPYMLLSYAMEFNVP